MTAEFSYDAAIDAAMAAQLAGLLDQSEALYLQVLEHEPDDPDALNLLGLLAQDRGDTERSLELLHRALAADPDFPEALTNLARVQVTTAAYRDAATSARRAITLDPGLAEAHLQLGRACIELAAYEEAETALRQCLALTPDLSAGHFLLGLSRSRQRAHGDALASFHESLRLQPDQPLAWLAIGESLTALGRLDEALAAHQRAVELDPHNASVQAGMAVIHRARFEPAESADACRRALAIDPNRADVQTLLGTNLASLGQFAAAATCFRTALALQPGSAEPLRQLTRIEPFGDVDDQEAGLRVTLADKLAPPAERIAAGFALGARLERAADYDGAFAAFDTANRLILTQRAEAGERLFDLRLSMTRTLETIHTFTPDYFAGLTDMGDLSEAPVFIVGMPRSGTTLVEQIAASHPDVCARGETKEIGFLAERLSAGRSDAGQSATWPASWDRDAARAAASAHVAHLAEKSGGARRVIDKLPDNIGLLGHIAVLFPNARVVICRRDPRDVCLSAWTQQFGDGMEWSYDLATCAARTREVAMLTDHWRQTQPLKILEIDYETLVADLEGQCRRLIGFLGLPWDPACLDFHKTERSVMTASYWQVRQPLYSGSAGKWRRYGNRLAPALLGLLGLIPEPDANTWPDLVADIGIAIHAIAIHFNAGRPDEAKTICRALLRVHPGHPDGTHWLGLAELDLGETEQAIATLTESVTLDAESAPKRLDLVRALLAAERTEEAVEQAQIATELAPESADVWTQLGNAQFQAENFAEAAVAMDYAAALAPDSLDAKIGRARASAQAEHFGTALALWREIVAAKPGWPEGEVSLAYVAAETGAYAEAREWARRAAANPDLPIGLIQRLAVAFMLVDLLAEAEATTQRGLELAPDSGALWSQLGSIHEYAGRFDDAAAAFRRALEHDPNAAEPFAGLVATGLATEDDEIVERMKERIGDETLSADHRSWAAFAMAGDLAKQKQYDAAFDAYALANRLRREQRPAGRAEAYMEHLRIVADATEAMFVPATFEKLRALGNPDETPTFIVGMPRSGTTLTEQIVASHPLVAGLGERRDIGALLSMTFDQPSFIGPENWDVDAIRRNTADLVAELRSLAPGAKRIVNKMPDNIMLLGQIAVLFPNAKIIVCNRDLRDVCWSCFNQSFVSPGMLWSDTLEDCAERAGLIQRIMNHWRRVLPIPIHEIQYEKLVSDLEGESRRLIDFLGLAWDPACLDFNKSERAVYTASVWQVRQPVYTTSVGRWRNYRAHLGPLLDGLAGLVPND